MQSNNCTIFCIDISRKETGDDANKKKEEYNAIPSLASLLKIIGVIIAIAGWVWPILSKI